MWNLITGVLYSDDSEDENPNQEQEDKAAVTSSSDPVIVSKPPSRNTARGTADGRDEQDSREEKHEKSSSALPLKAPTSEARSPKLIHLPQTNIVLSKLPPIKDDVNLPAKHPTSPLVPLAAPSQPVTARNPKRTTFASRDKEPKFVPYEPYKAAITPITNSGYSKSGPGKGRHLSRNNSRDSHAGGSQNAPTASSSSEEVSKSAEAPSSLVSANLLADRDAEVVKLREALAESEKQLRIQSQVNSEVKRLLVASVGEDIEAKVDYLTQDKAKLSADIRSYASKISKDFEEKEKLSVESNLWKSKFLACSVIVDELARWKAALLHTNESYEHQVRLLLHEHSLLWKSLMETYTTLTKLSLAFDPLKVETRDIPPPAEAVSLLGLADYVQQASGALKDRLVGHTGVKEPGVAEYEPELPEMIETPAEEGLKEILSVPLISDNADYSELASLAVTDAARPHLRKLGDKLNAPTGFKCCTHCQGSVQNALFLAMKRKVRFVEE